MKVNINPEILKDILFYDEYSGLFTWKMREEKMFKNAASTDRWNTRWANKQAFTCTTVNGYKQGNIFAKRYYAHRVAYAITYDVWPIEIDHINGDRTDNRISNLRDVYCRALNMKNSKLRKDNTSGYVGVAWNDKIEKWVSRINVDGLQIHLGVFEAYEDAISARINANLKYNFHVNHGLR